jgi:uncharacterized membrane protein YfcA
MKTDRLWSATWTASCRLHGSHKEGKGLTLLNLAFLGLAAVAAGIVNALAGGGSLLTFPVLVAVGVPPLVANVTNTVALCPGYLGATLAQARDLHGQRGRMALLCPVSILGGVVGAILLLTSGEGVFRAVVPFLILLASGLLAVQTPLRRWLARRGERSPSGIISERWAILPVGLAAIYGGYFGAGLSVMVLAVLGLLLNDTLTRANALKQFIALSVNVAAAVFFVLSGHVLWLAALVMAIGALIGGAVGGRLAGHINPDVLRRIVVVVGVVVAVIYLQRL